MQDSVAKLEINKEINLDTAIHIPKMPLGNHVLERSVQVFGVDAVRLRPQRHAAAEFFAEDFERDHKIRQHDLMIIHVLLRANARRRGPGQEFRVRRHVGHQIIHLLGAVRQGSGF